MTGDWAAGEDAKYNATVLALEVDKITKDAEAASRPPSAKKGAGRAKSPKKSTS